MLCHAKKTLLVATCLLLAAPAVRSQVLWTETFTAPTLDPLRWSVNAQCAPSGLVQPQNGECLLQDRAHLVSVAQFDPTQIGAYRVTCRWRWTDNNDSFMILVRSDGQPLCQHYGTTANGIELSTYMYAGAPWFGLGVRGTQMQLGPVTTSGPGGPVGAGIWYTAEIVDLGHKIKARVDGPNGQWYAMEANVLQDTTTQKRLSFHNREGGHQAFLDDVVVATVPQWQQVSTPTFPVASLASGMTFDEALGKVLVFGGHGNGTMYDSTWTFDGTSWAQLFPSNSPSARGTTMAYDALRGRAVIFGGWSGTGRNNDIWEWDGATWLQRAPAVSPPPRDNHPLAFDRVRGQVVLFGGRGNQVSGSDVVFGDTWLWDGTNWSAVSSAVNPPARWDASMAFDEARGCVVMVGGGNHNGVLPPDTWTWNGSQWTQAQPATLPGARGHACMTYDTASQRCVLFGGHSGSAFLSDTWEWDGSNWSQSPQSSPPSGRWQPQIAYDRSRGVSVMRGGIASPGSGSPASWLTDTWQLGPTAMSASYSVFGAGCPGPYGTTPILSAPAGSLPRIGSQSTLRVSNLPLNIVCVPIFVLGVSKEFDTGPLGIYLLPFDLGIFGWPGCQQLVSINDTVLAITNTGQADHQVTIPQLPILVGMQFHAQAFVLYSPSGVAVSNGITGTAGY